MKEATGEFSMTVVTIVAIIAIAGVIALLRDPLAEFINKTWQEAAGNVVDKASQL